MTVGVVLAISVVPAMATSTGEAITTGVIAILFGLLAWAGFRRRNAAVGWFYSGATVLALALTVIAASGHLFRGF